MTEKRIKTKKEDIEKEGGKKGKKGGREEKGETETQKEGNRIEIGERRRRRLEKSYVGTGMRKIPTDKGCHS